jgi:hypothetical protein
VPAPSDFATAKGISRQKVISVERGLMRWTAMFETKRIIDGPRISVRVDASPGASEADIDMLVDVANKIENLRYVIIETAFHNGERELAIASKHLWPDELVNELSRLTRKARVYITHLKPGEGAITMAEIEECGEAFNPRMLANGHVFKL